MFRLLKRKNACCISLKECCCEPGKIITASIKQAKKSINACIYKFDNQDVFNAIKDALSRGIKVNLILDYGKNKQNAFVFELKKQGATIKLWKKTEKLHATFMIIDENSVLSGTFDFTTQSPEHRTIDLIVSFYDFNTVSHFISMYNEMKICLQDVCKDCVGDLSAIV